MKRLPCHEVVLIVAENYPMSWHARSFIRLIRPKKAKKIHRFSMNEKMNLAWHSWKTSNMPIELCAECLFLICSNVVNSVSGLTFFAINNMRASISKNSLAFHSIESSFGNKVITPLMCNDCTEITGAYKVTSIPTMCILYPRRVFLVLSSLDYVKSSLLVKRVISNSKSQLRTQLHLFYVLNSLTNETCDLDFQAVDANYRISNSGVMNGPAAGRKVVLI